MWSLGNVFVCKREREKERTRERGHGRENERERDWEDGIAAVKFTVCGENGEMVYRITI